nr:hypothetical protein [uncultured Actinoplanes sp.]
MNVRLTDLLQPVLEGEPPLGDETDTVFRRADQLRRRRLHLLLASGGGAVALIGVAGYLLATTFLPDPAPRIAAPVPVSSAPSAPPADAVLAVLTPVLQEKKLKISPGTPSAGAGWRKYPVLDADGKSRGTVEVAIYHVTEDLCFPVPDAPGECAHTEWAPQGVEFVRYDDEQDPDRQVHQTIARRITDGRTLAVMAAGRRDAGAAKGKPALSGKVVERVATGQALFDAFGPAEKCTSGCPDFRVKVP